MDCVMERDSGIKCLCPRGHVVRRQLSGWKGTPSASGCQLSWQSLWSTHSVRQTFEGTVSSSGWKFIKGPEVRNAPKVPQQESVASSDCQEKSMHTSNVHVFPSPPSHVDCDCHYRQPAHLD